MYRTNTCGELRLSDAGKEVTLAGWVQRTRKMGGMTFVDVRDRYGLTQLVFNEADNEELCARANKLGREFCIQIKGTVSERESKNTKIPTGDIEILVKELNILSESMTPPFTIEDETDGGDDIHRFLNKKMFQPFQLMHINWKAYGDNDLLDNDGRNVIERFVEPLPYDTKMYSRNLPENNHIKSIVRGGLSYVRWKKTPHTPKCIGYYCCNPLGESVSASSPFLDYDFTVAYIRHYNTKTVGEWVRNKMKRGTPDITEERWKKRLNLNFFFAFNKKTEEKLLYAERILKDEL